MTEDDKKEEIDFLGLTKDENLPLPLRLFIESTAFKQAVQPDGNGKFPSHVIAIKNAYRELQDLKKKM